MTGWGAVVRNFENARSSGWSHRRRNDGLPAFARMARFFKVCT
jgi:hypothetical protein